MPPPQLQWVQVWDLFLVRKIKASRCVWSHWPHTHFRQRNSQRVYSVAFLELVLPVCNQ